MPDPGWPALTIIAVGVVVLFGWKRLLAMARSRGRSTHLPVFDVDETKTSPHVQDVHDLRDARAVPTSPRLSGDEVQEAHEAVVRAEDRVAEADAEVARLRAELVRHRHQGGSH